MTDVSSLRLDSLRLSVPHNKLFSPPAWAVRGDSLTTGAALHVIKEGEVVDTLKIDGRYTLFGRVPACADQDGVAVKLDHPSVSRVHAALVRDSCGSAFIVDLDSCHGTFVSGKRLEPFVLNPLHDRGVVGFGQSTRHYIMRLFPKNVAIGGGEDDAEKMNTLMNCMVSYKLKSPLGKPRGDSVVDQIMEEKFGSPSIPPKLERRVSFSCKAPEIIPTLPHPASAVSTPSNAYSAAAAVAAATNFAELSAMIGEGPGTPLTFMGGSPEMSFFRKVTTAATTTTPTIHADIPRISSWGSGKGSPRSASPPPISAASPELRWVTRQSINALNRLSLQSGSETDDISLPSTSLESNASAIDYSCQDEVVGKTCMVEEKNDSDVYLNFPKRVCRSDPEI